MNHLFEILEELHSHFDVEIDTAELKNIPVSGITYDSRKVQPGNTFVALTGSRVDGHCYLDEAQRLGATAFLVERRPEFFDAHGSTLIIVPDSREALCSLAAPFYGYPSRELLMVGVTGTNGKTSISVLLESIFKSAGLEVGLIGTIGTRYGRTSHQTINTTPESLDLQHTLRDMCKERVDAVAMEVSSHGLELNRVKGCSFDAAVISNVTQDHLDFHGSMEAYVGAKIRLFQEHLKPNAIAVINIDDPHHQSFIEAATKVKAQILSVSFNGPSESDVQVISSHTDLSGIQVELKTPQGLLSLKSSLIGQFNIENITLAATLAIGLGFESSVIRHGIIRCAQIPGRIEYIAGPPGSPKVFVDYAHTPDAIEKLLETLRSITNGRLITVFGCGGNRDRTKRPLMARAMEKFSDLAVLTSDNPRNENPNEILKEIEIGLERLQHTDGENLDSLGGRYTRNSNRSEAIDLAIRIAGTNDTVVIAGKGHETYQIVESNILPFDDREEARKALKRRFL